MGVEMALVEVISALNGKKEDNEDLGENFWYLVMYAILNVKRKWSQRHSLNLRDTVSQHSTH